MAHMVFYFSGTGNSLMVAKILVKELENALIVSMAKSKVYNFTKPYDTIGFVFPTYYGGIPRIVMRFMSNLPRTNKNAYYYAITTCGGFPGNSIAQTKAILQEKGITLHYGAGVRMAANNIIYYEVSKHRDAILQRSHTRILGILRDIKNRKTNTIRKPNALINHIYKKAIRNIASIAKNFNVNTNCTGCGICQTLCPVQNIELLNNKPAFNDQCELCLACLHCCPQKAINYKDKTQKRRRYTHPGIAYTDLTQY
jgi:ferredoxin/flavodoxin